MRRTNVAGFFTDSMVFVNERDIVVDVDDLNGDLHQYIDLWNRWEWMALRGHFHQIGSTSSSPLSAKSGEETVWRNNMQGKRD